MKPMMFCVLACVFMLVLTGSPAWGGKGALLSDTELDQVYGGDPPDKGVNVITTCGICSLTITDMAQQNASAVILVNAVGAVVAAQVNIIVNNGSVSTASQSNSSF